MNEPRHGPEASEISKGRSEAGARLGRLIDKMTPGDLFVFELLLDKTGLLASLEAKKVLPLVESPNPFDPETLQDKHDRWWREHPGQEEEFSTSLHRRDSVLRHLMLGAIIGRITPQLPPDPNRRAGKNDT